MTTYSKPIRLFDPAVRILVVGDVMLDGYARGHVERISPEAPVPVLRQIEHVEVAGGGANVAINIAALGGQSCLVGLVGEDPEGQRLESLLAASGVDARLVQSPARPTTFKLRILAGKHQMLRIDKEEVRQPDSDVEEQLIQQSVDLLPQVTGVILSDYQKGCLTERVLREIIGAARAIGVPVLVDPKRPDFTAYKGASYITPNRAEMKAATGIECDTDDDCRSAAALAGTQSDATILLTRSERGMALFSPDGDEIWLPTAAQEVFDVSGAGDSVIATFAYALLSGMSLPQSLRVANCAAGIVIGKAGTATTTEAELMAALDREHYASGPEIAHQSLADAVRIRAQWRAEKLVVGFTNGCFDLVHPGHIALLREAALQCDRLIVALNTDASVRRLKGASRPIQDERARIEVMAAIRHVDMVVTFNEDTPLQLIRALEPDVLIKGSDYQEHEIIGADVVRALGGEVVRVDLKVGHSTSALVARSGSNVDA